MKRKKKGFQIDRTSKESWFGDQFMKMTVIGLAVILAVGAVCFLAYQGLSRSVFFQVEEVAIKGCERTTPKQILAWTGLDVQTNLWGVRIGRLRKGLESQSWIATAVIDRDWPNKLSISIRERKPVAMVNMKDGLFYVDKRGVVFAQVLPDDDRDYPVITGGKLEMDSLTNEVKMQMNEALKFLSYAENGMASLPKQNISEIYLQPGGNLVLFMADVAFPIYLGTGDMRSKYGRLSKVFSWLYRKDKYKEASSIDMNYMASSETEDSKRNRVLVRLGE